MKKIVIIRHGESIWNQKNIFTGWTDIKLSKKGIKEAQNAGKILKKNNFFFNKIYTSVLNRSIHTAWEILYKLNLTWIKVSKNWQLNERHYGALQGLNKDKTIKKYGEKKVQKWRRSYYKCPPKITIKDKRYPGKEKKYKYINIKNNKIPTGESLFDTYNRVIPFWKKKIYPKLKNNNLLIVAHGNSLRALIKYIEKISENDILKLEIPTGIPLVYEYLIKNKFKIIKKYYLK